MSAGQLAQTVQISGFPTALRPGRRCRRTALMEKYCDEARLLVLAWRLARRLRRARRRGPGGPRGSPTRSVYGPTTAAPDVDAADPGPQRAAGAPTVARALDGGASASSTSSGDVGVEPASLETASDATLEGLTWSRWGAGGAAGAGELRVTHVQPDLRGRRDRTRAARRSRSRGVKTCDGRRYFDAARSDRRRRHALGRPAPAPTCARLAEAGRAGGAARGGRTAGTASARSARRTSGRPTLGGLHQLARQPVGVDRADRRPPRACSCPSRPGRRASARRATSGRPPSSG